VAASGKFGRPVADIARRMRALGYATPDPDTLLSEPATDDDLALSHVDLDPEKSAYQPRQLTVSPAHLVAASGKFGRPVADIARRMRALGYATPDPDTLLSEPATDDDLALTRPDPDTFMYWYRSMEIDVSPPHLVAASHTLGRPVADIARRMRLLGYATPDPDAVTSRVADMSDVKVVTSILGRGGEISLAELLSKSRQVQLSPAATARWFGELGYTVMGYDRIPDEIRPLFQLDATARWWSATPPGDSDSNSPFWARHYVSFGEILQESVKHNLAAKRCAELLHACGYAVPEPSGLPDRVLSASELELAQASGLQQEVDRATLVGAAHRLQLRPAELRRRLSEIGIQAAAANDTEWPPSALDVALIEHIRPPDDVPRGWVIAISMALNLPASTIAGRLRTHGFEVDGEPPEAPDPAHLAVLDTVSERGLAGQRTKVAMRWFLETCSKTSTAPAQLSAALRAVGFDAPPASADRVLPEDAPILGLSRSQCLERAASRVRGGESGFNTLSAPFNRWRDGQVIDEIRVPIPVLVGAGILLERPVQDIAERLYALGFDIADPATVTSEDVAHDIRLLHDLWFDRPDHEWEILVDIAIRANWDLARAARRLYHYGLSLPAGLKIAPSAAPEQPATRRAKDDSALPEEDPESRGIPNGASRNHRWLRWRPGR
jgi:hypothetical protein